jgi:hypothetical protein
MFAARAAYACKLCMCVCVCLSVGVCVGWLVGGWVGLCVFVD